MPADYIQKARSLDWIGLRLLWAKIVSGSATGWAAGKAMEHLVLRAFELSGADVRWPYEVPIAGETAEQIDGAIHVGMLSCLIECKDSANAVNIEPIAKLRNQLLRRHAGAVGLVFSRSGFTTPALTIAQFIAPQSILLWGGDELAVLLEQEDLLAPLHKKYRHSVETGIPDYDTRVEALP